MKKVSMALLMIGMFWLSGPSGTALGADSMPDLVIDARLGNDSLRVLPTPWVSEKQTNELHQNRSYLFIVAVSNFGAETALPFTVRTECIRESSQTTLGEARVVLVKGFSYAAYDVFPSSAGAGPCELRTTVDALGEIQESKEGMSTYGDYSHDQVHNTSATITP